MKINRLDHLVLTVADIEATCDFYAQVLGMTVVTFGHGRVALQFGRQKINLHQAGYEFEPKAEKPTPGSADLCFIIEAPLAEAIKQITSHNISIVAGPVARTGALGAITSVYIRDPDFNLIEIASYS